MTYAIDFTGVGWSWNDWVRPPQRAQSLASAFADKASSLRPNLVIPELVFARLSLAERHYDTAIEHARRAVERQPGNADAHATLAMALAAAGQHSDALQVIQEAFRRDPKPPPSTYGTLGIIQFSLRDYSSAITSLERAIEALVDGGSWFYSPFLIAAYGNGLPSLLAATDAPASQSVKFLNLFVQRPGFLSVSLATFRRKNSKPSCYVPVAVQPGNCKVERFRA